MCEHDPATHRYSECLAPSSAHTLFLKLPCYDKLCMNACMQAAHPETVHPVSLAASPNGTQQQQQRQQHPSSSLSLLGAHASQHQQLLLSLHAQHAHTSRAASMPYLPILPLSAAPSGQRHAHTPGFASQQHMGLDAHSGGGASMHGRHIGSCGNLPCGSSPLQRLSPITEASMPGMGLAPPLRRHASGTYGQYLLQHHQRHLHLQQQQQQMLSQQLSQQQLQMLVGGPGLNAAQAVCAASEALLGLAAGGCGGMPSVRSSGGSANHTAGTGTGTGTHSASCAAADDGEGETSRPAAGTSRPESCSSIPDHAHGGIRRHAGVGGRGRGGRRSGSARLLAASHPLDRAASAQVCAWLDEYVHVCLARDMPSMVGKVSMHTCCKQPWTVAA